MSASRPPRYRVCVYELHDAKTTKVIDANASGFITAVATHFDGENLDVHFGEGGPGSLQQLIADAITVEHSPRHGTNALQVVELHGEPGQGDQGGIIELRGPQVTQDVDDA